MATYKEKVGTAVVNYAGDYPGAVEGELWYDSTNKDFKYLYPNVSSAGTWRTGGSLNTARDGIGNAGSYTSALGFGGGSKVTITEKYDATTFVLRFIAKNCPAKPEWPIQSPCLMVEFE